ncbi:MAG: histidine phosphatase family protein [Oscillospiraceae bacterium]|nr:histidine phosphatase family protein [Oscillospiraceae bacterium]
MIIAFIRHGKTEGNLRRAYIGRTDEPLCGVGIEELRSRKFPSADIVIASPMKRCIQTAEMIYPDVPVRIYDDLRECDFGKFEGKCYSELNGDPDYQEWIDSGGELPFPAGESRKAFSDRCCEAFLRAVSDINAQKAAMVVHGGTIMAILERFARPERKFYDYMKNNCCGYLTEYQCGEIRIIKEV